MQVLIPAPREVPSPKNAGLAPLALLRQGKGWTHMSGDGHEAIAALAYHLTERDYIFPICRCRALMHARGMSVTQMARDFLAREDSSSAGRNLPGHVSSSERRLYVDEKRA